MSDEFPTLEAAAALGVVVLSVRALLIAQQTASIRRDNEKLSEALKSGAHARAVELCARAESPAYAEVARRVLAVVEERGRHLDAARFHEQLAHAASSGLARATRGISTGRARDLIALSVLFGALAYGFAGGSNVSPLFLTLVGAACAVALLSFALRARVARELASAVASLLSAAASSATSAPDALSDGPCRSCGRAEQIVVVDPNALGTAPGLTLEELRICRHCGRLHGKIKDPDRVPIGPEHGTALAVTRDPVGLPSASNPREHEG